MDGGLTDGPLGISEAWFTDAVEQLYREGREEFAGMLANTGWPVAVWNPIWAKEIARAGWRRYDFVSYNNALRGAATPFCYEALARCFNGGPQWRTKPPEVRARTAGYWRRVKARLEAGR
jgi:hypothetical protein